MNAHLYVKHVKKDLNTDQVYTHINSKDERSFVCQICYKEFNQASNLYKQQLIHRDKHSFLCQTCYKGFKQSLNLYKHQLIHKDERSFV